MDTIEKEIKQLDKQNKFWDIFIKGYTQCCCNSLRQMETFLKWVNHQAKAKEETYCYCIYEKEIDEIVIFLDTREHKRDNYYVYVDIQEKTIKISGIEQEFNTVNFKDVFIKKNDLVKELKQGRIIKKSNIKHNDEHMNICKEMNELYKRKNKDYGNSFSKTYAEYGAIMLAIRLEDKLSRYKKLALGSGQAVNDESIRDTLIDLANYSIMGIMELDREREK